MSPLRMEGQQFAGPVLYAGPKYLESARLNSPGWHRQGHRR